MKKDYDFQPKKAYSKVQLPVYLLISFIFTAVLSLGCFLIIHMLLQYNFLITGANRGDYFTIMGTHCSIVFLTTSLMAVLSEKSRYIYWVDMVTKILIFPKYMSFLALSVYSISTILWSFIGFLTGIGPIVIGSFVCGIASVTILFSRMISVYYQNDRNKEDIKEYLLGMIEKNDYEKYLINLKEVTFIKAGSREFYDVYDNLELIEDCLLFIWKSEPRKPQHIFQPSGFCEELYASLVMDLAISYPQEIQYYIDNHANENETVRNLCYTAYPTILNSYISSGRPDLFDRTLCKWSAIKSQKYEVVDYMTRLAVNHKELTVDYYSELFNIFNHETAIHENDEVYISVLQNLYFENPDVFDYITDYRGNRQSIYNYYLDTGKAGEYPVDILVSAAERENCTESASLFEKYLAFLLDSEIYTHKNAAETEKRAIEEKPVLRKVVGEMIRCKRPEDIEFLVSGIMKLIENTDSEVYRNANDQVSFYADFEQWALDYALIVTKNELEKENRNYHSRENEKKAAVLQKMLETLNYKGRRK